MAGVSFVIETITRHSITWTAVSGGVTTALFVAWQFFYFGYSWAASGKTSGMAVLGIRVVQADGTGADAWRGVVRALVFPFSFLFLGLGFLGLLVQGQRQALHDLVAGTAVVYAWDARAARLRFLAREAETGPAPRLSAPAEPADRSGGAPPRGLPGDDNVTGMSRRQHWYTPPARVGSAGDQAR